MRLLVIVILVVAVVSAVVLVQTGVDFKSTAGPRIKKPVPIPRSCTKDSDCEINRVCPPNTKCIRFFDNEIKFSCQNGKCVANIKE